MKKIFLALSCVISFSSFASSNIQTERFSWDGMDVVYLADERLPTYMVQFYFADGALADSKERAGETEMMFELLSRGTSQYDQKKLADFFEFYGVDIASQVVHEYATFGYSGLVKDIQETSKMVCHMFTSATFPKEEVKKYEVLMTNQLKNTVINHAHLAERVFRQVSLGGSPYAVPTDGTLKTLPKIKQAHLKEKNRYFNQQVKKRIYLTGPRKMLNGLKEIIATDCGWKNTPDSVSRAAQNDTNYVQRKAPEFYLVPVPKANQAQIRVGRYISSLEAADKNFNKLEYLNLVSEFLGGGFTSKLMQELRVKRGLTYSAGGVISLQKYYGRTVVTTFTKNETLNETIKVIQQSLADIANGKFEEKDVETIIQNMSGAHSFKFEANKSFMQNLAFFDHIEKPYNDLYNFNATIAGIKKKEIASIIGQAFDWNSQVVLVVGDPSLEKELSKLGTVTVLNYKDYL